jgi:hypothetical protein
VQSWSAKHAKPLHPLSLWSHREQGPGSRGQGAGAREQRPGTRDQGPGSRCQGRDQGPGTRDQGPGTRGQGPESREQGPGTRDQGVGSRDQGLGSRGQGPGTRGRDQGPGAGTREGAAGQGGSSFRVCDLVAIAQAGSRMTRGVAHRSHSAESHYTLIGRWGELAHLMSLTCTQHTKVRQRLRATAGHTMPPK